MPGSRPLLATVLLAGLAIGPARGQTTAADLAATAPAICGPRCVEFVLDWYGRPVDVSDLIDELQQGRPYQMVSLAALAEALEKRGLHAKAVTLGWGATLDWPHPVVRHSTRADGAGHFTVLVPPRGDLPRLVWTGDAGYKRALTDEDGAASGVLLLTSPEPIRDVQLKPHRGPATLVIGVCSVVLIVAGTIGLTVRGRRRQAATIPGHLTEAVQCPG